MAEKRSDKSKYKSPSTGDFVTCGQYIAELLCQRQAEKNNSGALAYKFWNTPKWSKIFRRQVTDAYKMIKEFGEEPVIKFLNSEDGKRVYSFGFPGIKEKIAALKLVLEERAKKEAQTAPDFSPACSSSNIEQKPRPAFGKRSLVSKLKQLENKDGEKGKGNDNRISDT